MRWCCIIMGGSRSFPEEGSSGLLFLKGVAPQTPLLREGFPSNSFLLKASPSDSHSFFLFPQKKKRIKKESSRLQEFD